jgi:WD40 repeat protein
MRVVPDVPLFEPVRENQGPLQIEALITHRVHVTVAADVCGDCGFVELRALEPQRLYEAWLRSESEGEPGGAESWGGNVSSLATVRSTSMKEPIVIDAHGKHAQAVAFTEDSKTLVSTGQDAKVRLWSVPGFKPAGVFEGHTKSVNGIAFSPDQKRLATPSTDGTVRVWAFLEGKTVHVFEKMSYCTFSPDGKTLAGLEPKSRVMLCDPETGESQWTIDKLDARLVSLAFVPGGNSLLAAGAGSVHRLDVKSGEKIASLPAHGSLVMWMCFSPARASEIRRRVRSRSWGATRMSTARRPSAC